MQNNPINWLKDILLPLIFLFFGILLEFFIARALEDIFYGALIITVLILSGAFYVFVPSKGMKWIAIFVTVAVAIFLVAYYRTTGRPSFEINFLGLPLEGDHSYYVTNNLISSDGDLSDYPELEVSPLLVEVIPHYLGDERFGNVILRVSGSASVKEIPLWPDFDKSAQTQTVRLELADILKLSGIKKNREDLDTNLMLGEKPYQEEVLKFEVIRLAAPGRPFESAKELPVKNAPWRQEVSLADRDELMLDYALTNFGGTARFGCDITVARTLADVTADDHSFWSGVEGFSWGPDCEPFTLETGETYKTSFPLNEETLGQEFPHGRYLVEVYSFAERKDVLLKDGSSFENYDDRWL